MMSVILCGYGSIGKRHFQNLQQIWGDDVGLTVLDPALSDGACSELEAQKVTCVKDVSELGDCAGAAAIICTPNHIRMSVVEPLIAKGVRYCFIEKPVASTIAEAEKLVALMQAHDCYSFVGCNLRFHSAVQCLKAELDKGTIGKPLYARATFSHYLPNWRPSVDYRKTYSAIKAEGGGIVLDAIHEPDYLLWLFGAATLSQTQCINTGHLDIDVEDFARYMLAHDNGVRSEVLVDYLRMDKLRKCEIVGEKGTLEWESRSKKPEQVNVTLYTLEGPEILLKDENYDANEQYVEEMRYFVHCVQENKQPMNSVSQALETLKIVESVKHDSI